MTLINFHILKIQLDVRQIKNLARVSHTPGRTQQINFFSIVDKLLLADLPGYGFAKVSKSQKADWERLMTYYLETSNHLRLVNLLIDSRRGIKDNDIDLICRSHQVILITI